MTPDQKNKLAAGVAGALPSKGVFNDGKNLSANPPAQPNAMGAMGAQPKGKAPSASGAGSTALPLYQNNTASSGAPSSTKTQLSALNQTNTSVPGPTTSTPDQAKSEPGFFGKIWNGIKSVANDVFSSRITTGILVGLTAGLIITGFGAPLGLIIAASAIGAGIGLLSGPLANTSNAPSQSKPPLADTQTPGPNAQTPAPVPVASPTQPLAMAQAPKEAGAGSKIKSAAAMTMTDASKIAEQLTQNKSDKDLVVVPLVQPAAKNSKFHQPSRKRHRRKNTKKASAHVKSADGDAAAHHKVKQPIVTPPPSSIWSGTLTGVGVGGSLGGFLGVLGAVASIASLPAWVPVAAGVMVGGAVGAGAVAAWNAWNHYKSPSSNSNSTDSKSSKTPASPAPAAAPKKTTEEVNQ
jgi:hypothetical protein